VRGAARSDDDFGRFVATFGGRLQTALEATYGPVDGRVATIDALSWAWEHWDRVVTLSNPVAYLYRVGQTATRSLRIRPIPVMSLPAVATSETEVEVELVAAVGRLPERQRTAVMLVHAFGWTLRDVAEILDIAPSTVRVHVERALAALQANLEVPDAC
jgi:RNA polymerase sigma-70 factor (ECF subfamily)